MSLLQGKDMYYWLLLDSTVNKYAGAPRLAPALREAMVKAQLEWQEMSWVKMPAKDKGERVGVGTKSFQ